MDAVTVKSSSAVHLAYMYCPFRSFHDAQDHRLHDLFVFNHIPHAQAAALLARVKEQVHQGIAIVAFKAHLHAVVVVVVNALVGVVISFFVEVLDKEGGGFVVHIFGQRRGGEKDDSHHHCKQVERALLHGKSSFHFSRF